MFLTGSQHFPDPTSPRARLFQSLIEAADADRAGGVTRGTAAKANIHWRRWLEFSHFYLGLPATDPFLSRLHPPQRVAIMCAFGAAVRDGFFATGRCIKLAQGRGHTPTVRHVAEARGLSLTVGHKPLKGETVQQHVNGVAQIFRDFDQPDPREGTPGRGVSSALTRLYRGYKNSDAAPCRQMAIPLDLIRTITTASPTDEAKVTCFNQLIRLAVFWACRSCEYCLVDNPEDRRTRVLTLEDFSFRKDHHNIDHDNSHLHRASTVTVTFRFQKKETRDDSVTQYHSGDDSFSPTVAAAMIVRRLRQMPGCSASTTIDTYYDHVAGRRYRLRAKEIRAMLRAKLEALDYRRYGLQLDRVGLHSIRASAAMAMCLAGVPSYIIMLIGRWASAAFLFYIRKQIEEFSKGVSSKMISAGSHHHINASPNHTDHANLIPYTSLASSPRHGTSIDQITDAYDVWNSNK